MVGDIQTNARMSELPPDALERVADYFQTLSEPTRLQILSRLRAGECCVGDLALHCGFTSANISRHLNHLSKQGLVRRRSEGTTVYYRIGDESVNALCDLVCGNIARHLQQLAREHATFGSSEH